MDTTRLIHLTEKKRIFENALMVMKDMEREKLIIEMEDKLELNETCKTCPKCSKPFKKTLRKCPHCSTFYQQYLQEYGEAEMVIPVTASWNTSVYHEHVPDMHPEHSHSVQILDPIMCNPNNKYDDLSICHFLRERAGIANFHDDSKKRRWCYVSADAAIAVQVRE